MWFPTRSDTNPAAQAQKMARDWKFQISRVEEIKIKTDPLRAVNTLMRKGLDHTAVSTIKVSSVTL